MDILQILTPIMLSLMMVGLGLGLKPRDFRAVAASPLVVIVGVIAQMAGLPALGFATAVWFDLAPALAVGVVVLTCCAGGVVSGLLTQMARGDVALSISLTCVSMAIGAFSIPLIVNAALIYFLNQSDHAAINILPTSLRLMAITILPVAVGMIIRWRFPRFSEEGQSLISRISYVLLAAIIVATIIDSGEDMIPDLGTLAAPLMVLNLAAMALGLGVALIFNLGFTTAKTLAIEVGIQNSATGIYISVSLLNDPTLALPSMIYTGVAFVNVALFIILFRGLPRHARTS